MIARCANNHIHHAKCDAYCFRSILSECIACKPRHEHRKRIFFTRIQTRDKQPNDDLYDELLNISAEFDYGRYHDNYEEVLHDW